MIEEKSNNGAKRKNNEVSREANKQLEIIFKEMFRRVGEKYTKEYTSREDWFRSKTWTLREQADFGIWLGNYLYSNEEARKIFDNTLPKNRKVCGEAALFFAFNYGWMLKEENNHKDEVK